MNSIIKELLSKVKNAVIPSYNDTTTEIIINKGDKQSLISDLLVGHVYRVRVDKSLTDPQSNWYQTIHSNWNNGNGLTEALLDLTVISSVGKMLKVSCVGTDNPSYVWQGFLPKSNIGVIEEI